MHTSLRVYIYDFVLSLSRSQRTYDRCHRRWCHFFLSLSLVMMVLSRRDSHSTRVPPDLFPATSSFSSLRHSIALRRHFLSSLWQPCSMPAALARRVAQWGSKVFSFVSRKPACAGLVPSESRISWAMRISVLFILWFLNSALGKV